jgi:hypothetical protein
LRKLDKRTRESKYLRQIESDLYAHLGGRERASAPQKLLLERTAADLLRLRLYDDRILAGEELSDHEGRIIGALRNSVRLSLKALGLEGSARSKATGASAHLARAVVAAGKDTR